MFFLHYIIKVIFYCVSRTSKPSIKCVEEFFNIWSSFSMFHIHWYDRSIKKHFFFFHLNSSSEEWFCNINVGEVGARNKFFHIQGRDIRWRGDESELVEMAHIFNGGLSKLNFLTLDGFVTMGKFMRKNCVTCRIQILVLFKQKFPTRCIESYFSYGYNKIKVLRTWPLYCWV
jgi:hypothetical protein